MCDIIGGIEGGSTHSTIVLVNEKGEIIAQETGPGTNHSLVGIEKCWDGLAKLVDAVKAKAGIPVSSPLKALGLGLSGCEVEATNKKLEEGLLNHYPRLSKLYAVGSDTDGSIAAVSNKGGITCIAGTGSNTLLKNPDGSRFQCGGYGYLLGDEGGAWKIAHTAIKCCIDDIDGFDKSRYPITWTWRSIRDHFCIESHLELLDFMYNRDKFDKAFIAKLCKKLAAGADEGDSLCLHLFEQAGMYLAKAISAVVPNASQSLVETDGLHILCVGSVWLSWHLLKPGFVGYLERPTCPITRISLLRIKTPIAVGAAYMACDKHGLGLPRDYSKNYDVFFSYSKTLPS